MRKLAVLLLLATCALWAADCQNGVGMVTCRVTGPELPTNLWQFATIRGWVSTTSGTVVTSSRNHQRLAYGADDYFAFYESACGFWGLSTPDGSTVVGVAEYTTNTNETTQRAYVAAFSAIPTTAHLTVDPVAMGQVPPATATNDAGTVTITWTVFPAQDEITGHRVLRSADGIANWSTVADKGPAETSATDTPGAGTWYYAVAVMYLGTPTQQVSPHGLADDVTIAP